MRPLNGLCNVNVELTSRCNKDCWCCGRRKIEREHPEIAAGYGDMCPKLMRRIACQIQEGVVVQLHNNGEPLLYPHFGHAVRTFDSQITNIVTNGKLLLAKASEIIGTLDTMAISIIENDPEVNEQYKIIESFLRMKGDNKPHTVLRLNGDIDQKRYKEFGLVMTTRTIHSPMGSFGYRRRPTIPEIGVCLDMLHHLSIDRKGRVSICVRFDPEGLGIIGDANKDNLWNIWDGRKRSDWKQLHIQGERHSVPLCSQCEFWGVPTGKD